MTYKVKLSKKNQGAFPVNFLRELGLNPNEENELIFYKNLDGNYTVTTPQKVIKKTAGSLKISKAVAQKLKGKTPQQIMEMEQQAIAEYHQKKSMRGL